MTDHAIGRGRSFRLTAGACAAAFVVFHACAPAAYETSTPVSISTEDVGDLRSLATQLLDLLGYEPVNGEFCRVPGLTQTYCFHRVSADRRDQIGLTIRATRDVIAESGTTSGWDVKVQGRSYQSAETGTWVATAVSAKLRADVDSLVRTVRRAEQEQ